MSVRLLGKLKEKLADGIEMVAAGGRVEELRRVKDEEELAKIAEASKLADEVWHWSLRARPRRPQRARGRPRRRSADPRARRRPVLPGDRRRRPQRRSAARRARRARDRPRRAGRLRHGGPARRLLLRRDPHLRHRRPRGERREPSTRWSARRSRPRWWRSGPGIKGEDVDKVAREIIDAAGHGDRFGHGLGHGVGLEVHEAPRLSLRSDDVLAAGEVVTVEPGRLPPR